ARAGGPPPASGRGEPTSAPPASGPCRGEAARASRCRPPPAARRESTTTVALENSPPPAPRRSSWPDLVRHTFAVTVLTCPRCGGRMRVLATIEDPVVVRRILTHLGRPRSRRPGRRPPTCST